MTPEQKQEVSALQAEIPKLLGRIAAVKQTLANNDLSAPSRRNHEQLLTDLQDQLQAVKDELGVVATPADPVASMSFGEKFVAALKIALDKGLIADGIRDKVAQMLEPANLVKTAAMMAGVAIAAAAMQTNPAGWVLDAGIVALVGADGIVAAAEIYYALQNVTMASELDDAASVVGQQLGGQGAGPCTIAYTRDCKGNWEGKGWRFNRKQ